MTMDHSLLVLGGARSGKSRYAQARAEATGLDRCFIATAQGFDDEMQDRITRHRQDRDALWQTVEAPMALADAICANAAPRRVLLIDCLTLWTSNLLLGDRDIDAATDNLVAAIAAAPGPIILVANEVGLGIVPDNALARRFRDEAGRLHQRLAAQAGRVVFMVAGLPMQVK